MNRISITLLLLAVFFSGCSPKESTAGNPVVSDLSSEGEAVRPESFEASIGGFLGASYRVELQSDGMLRYQHNPQTFTSSPGTRSQQIKVTDDQWREFRNGLDQANVWTWKKDYTDPNVLDGTQWNLQIRYNAVSIATHGSNAFPPKQDFERFRAAVVELLDGRAFE